MKSHFCPLPDDGSLSRAARQCVRCAILLLHERHLLRLPYAELSATLVWTTHPTAEPVVTLPDHSHPA